MFETRSQLKIYIQIQSEKAKYLIFSVPKMATKFPTNAKRGHSFLKLCRHLTGTPFRIVNEMEYLFEEKHF